MLLQRLVSLVAAGHVTQPDASFVRKFSVDLLHTAFGRASSPALTWLTRADVQLSTVSDFVASLFELHADPTRFKVAVRSVVRALG